MEAMSKGEETLEKDEKRKKSEKFESYGNESIYKEPVPSLSDNFIIIYR